MSKIGFDANVLIYAADSSAGRKYTIAKALLDSALFLGTAFIPAQVLGEFCWARTRKQCRTTAETRAFVDAWRATATIGRYDDTDVVTALDTHARHNLPFWDAPVWAVATGPASPCS